MGLYIWVSSSGIVIWVLDSGLVGEKWFGIKFL